jgi:sorbitol-specific phosphotransferase system component IIBC
MWRRWLRKVTGQPYRRGVVHNSRIGGTVNCYKSNPALYAVNLDAVLAYVCKGVSPSDAARLSIKHEPGGIIIGKRVAGAQVIWKKSGSVLLARALE